MSLVSKGWRQHFVYDDRTKSIRVAKMKSYALSNEKAAGPGKQGMLAVFRKWKATPDQH